MAENGTNNSDAARIRRRCDFMKFLTFSYGGAVFMRAPESEANDLNYLLGFTNSIPRS